MASSTQVPGVYPVAVNGRPFLVDLSPESGGFLSSSVPITRDQADQSARPGEQSLSFEDLWRRTVESWHHGAGQTYADRAESDPFRFRTSLHVNPWTKYQISRLSNTGETEGLIGVTGDSSLAVAGDHLYWQRDSSIECATAIESDGTINLTNIAGYPANVYSCTADGALLYTVHGVADVYVTTGTTEAVYCTNSSYDLRLVAFAKDRLLGFSDVGEVFDMSTDFGGSLSAPIWTHRLSVNWVWSGATSGTSHIYMCGYSGTGSEAHGAVYRTAVVEDGTALDIPVVAARLPDGEQAWAVCGYLGLVFIGTSSGYRVCIEAADGSLIVGPLTEIPGGVRCFEPHGSQVWFGWSNFNDFSAVESAYSGLGRIDLAEYNPGDGAPAYATDIMGPTAGITQDVCTFAGKRVFIAGNNLYAEAGTSREVGRLVSGRFTYGLSELKTFHYLTVPGDGAPLVVPYASSTDATQTSEGGLSLGLSPTNLVLADALRVGAESAGSNAYTYDLEGRRAMALEYRIDMYDVPINQVTLLARPAIASRSETGQVTLLIPVADDVNGLDHPRDPADDVAFIRGLVLKGSAVPFQDAGETYPVVIEDYRFIRTGDVDMNGKWVNGAIRISYKRFDTVTPLFRAASTGTASLSSTLTVDAPDGTLMGDVLLACVAWNDDSIDAPTVPGWTLMDTFADSDLASAIYRRSPDVGALNATFDSPVRSAGVVVAYTQGSLISSVTSLYDNDGGPSVLLINEIIEEPIAAITATVSRPPTDSTVLVPPQRSRARAVVADGASDIVVEVGDGFSNSTFSTPAVPAAEFIDAMTRAVPYEEQVRVYINKLT